MKGRFDPRHVLVSVEKLDAAWRADHPEFYVAPGGEDSNQPGKYEAAKRDVLAGIWTPPCVSFADDGKKVAFTDGRHHFAAARDLGRQSVIVEVEPAEDAAKFREKFGS